MASFCSGCGFPQAANVTFCPNCGARQQTAGSAPPPLQQPAPSTAPATMAPAKTGSGLKILLVLVAFLAVAGIAAIGGLWYLGHRVKQAVVEQAKAYGVEMPKASPAHSSASPARLPKPCDFLSNEEVAKLIGEPIERSQAQPQEGCWYFGPAGLSTKLANEQVAGAVKSFQTPSNDGADAVSALQRMGDTVGAGEQANNNGAEVPLLMLIVDPDGQAQMTAISASNALFGGLFKAAGAKGVNMTAEIPGLGDRALRLPKLGLNVLKGEVLIRIVPGPVPDAETKSINVARAVLAKL